MILSTRTQQAKVQTRKLSSLELL